jgi:hypothetical protein
MKVEQEMGTHPLGCKRGHLIATPRSSGAGPVRDGDPAIW